MTAQELADLIDTGIFPEGTLALATKMLRKQAAQIANLEEQFDKAVDFLTRINTGKEH